MKPEKTFWQRIGMHQWFLKDDVSPKDDLPPSLTPDEVYHYIIEKFHESIKELSFADRVVFYHEYIICFNTEDYKDFMEKKKGLFGLITQESVKEFHELLQDYRAKGKNVVPSSNKWVFRFVSHPDYNRGDKGFIGKLLPDTNIQKQDNLRVTYIPRQTGISQTLDINQDVLQAFHYYSEGYYELPYVDVAAPKASTWQNQNAQAGRARLETILPDKSYTGKKLEYIINDDEITISGNEAETGAPRLFRIPSDWVNTPHLKIRFDRSDSKFYLSSFGEKTILNEKEIQRSDEKAPSWTELPINSHIVLNGIVGINIFKA